ncbi:hypothetical protein E4U22_001258 [Claviceps purpurea]|uniref:NAD dependent epimerase/dehydratase n=1 Tax=Claviceps aff. purpurea TaxID=1967640 RepID=A0A9P7QN68_9HYPO|nr:hypothetical protein E4U37_006074 [Claviceps purpurea]KAG6301042.1 hypothetical protein E4U09_005948 [Claviceps aff. purpurea]KAG6173103.1 hypothetical protein E4U51_006263 [Claviceps purpurea]KAG6191671.1 hypothetical protein E4U36_006552 [Claviceps purpurea]KAG6257485.1 hypothetical protein E4U23_005095 [Claviceps purpurea]
MAPPNQILGEKSREVPMRVIVHGLHRTGSLSTRTALHQLGIHNCYHMADVFANLETDAGLWIRAMQSKFGDAGKDDKWTRADWDKLLGDSQACVDVPSAFFTIDLAEAYPEAKVVILNRDPEKWYESVNGSVAPNMKPTSAIRALQHLYLATLLPDFRQWTRLVKAIFQYCIPFDHATEKDKAIAWYNESYRRVREAIPADRRLEFSVKDGFRPLCEFLDVPVPTVRDEQTGQVTDAPFPHVNDRASFDMLLRRRTGERMRRANRVLWQRFCEAFTVAALGCAGYYVWKGRWGVRFW